MTINALILNYIDPFQPDAAPRLRDRLTEVDEWINHALDATPATASDLLRIKRHYQRSLRVAEAIGADKYRLALDYLQRQDDTA